jgi:hypothetical protein
MGDGRVAGLWGSNQWFQLWLVKTWPGWKSEPYKNLPRPELGLIQILTESYRGPGLIFRTRTGTKTRIYSFKDPDPDSQLHLGGTRTIIIL